MPPNPPKFGGPAGQKSQILKYNEGEGEIFYYVYGVHKFVHLLSQHLIRGTRGKKYEQLVLASLKSYRHELLRDQSYINLAGLGLVLGWFGGGLGVILCVFL